jgi:hypothetical protein
MTFMSGRWMASPLVKELSFFVEDLDSVIDHIAYVELAPLVTEPRWRSEETLV